VIGSPPDGQCQSGRSAADALRHQAPPMPLERPEIHQVHHLHQGGFLGRVVDMPLGDRLLTLTGRRQAPRRDQPLVVNEKLSRHDRGDEAFLHMSRSSTESVAQGDERRRMTGSGYLWPRFRW
jgi:hypothetical protein